MKPAFSVWLEEDGRHVIGEKEAEILQGVKKFGSLMATAKSLGMTYAHVWNVVEGLSKRLGKPVVSAFRGGEGGGGTVLTAEGEGILEQYEELEGRVGRFLGESKRHIFVEAAKPDLSIIGSSCPGVKILAELVEGFNVEVVEVGSSAGLTAVMLGEADLAGIHLYDPTKRRYNITAVSRTWPQGRSVLIRGYAREQGLVVKKGNPKGIRGFDDLKGRARLVNRNIGSGTREVIDRLMEANEISIAEVKGYDHEVRTHEEVARAIDEGRADVGVALRSVADAYGLEFMPLCEEQYDFVCERRRLSKPSVKAFIDVLRSQRFKDELKRRTSGIKPAKNIGEIIEIP